MPKTGQKIEILVINQLEERLEKMKNEDNMNQNPLIEKTEADLEELVSEKVKGCIFRSKCRWIHEGEKMSKYFMNLEKSRAGAKSMTILITEGNEKIYDSRKIVSEQARFYEKLYTTDPNISIDYVNHEDVTITNQEAEALNQEFTIEELTQALKTSKKGKTLGCDGLTTEFYVVFWQQIKTILFEAIQYCYENEEMYESATRGVITSIPKKSRDSRFLKNLCGITLLNVDFKLVEKMMANRLKPILKNLIHSDQKGFLAGRKISANIRCIIDIMQHLEEEREEGIVISIDYLKCFDRIEKCALIGALKYFKFPEYITKWTEIFYKKVSSCIINNGKVSGFFPVTRSVRQGAPCSVYYFIIVAELLAIFLRKNKTITGIEVNQFKKLFGQYADDMDIYSKDNDKNVSEIITILNKFCQNTGLKINYDKTSVYRIGKKREQTISSGYTAANLRMENDKINVLGVVICENKEKMIKENYEELIVKTKGILCNWQGRNLSLIGKVQVINALCASLYVYKMYVMPRLPENIEKTLNEIMKNFIWNGRKAKISLKMLQLDKMWGGVKLVNFRYKDDALKASWISHLKIDPFLENMAYKFLCPTIREDIWKCNISPKDVRTTFKDSFWRDVLQAWAEINYNENPNETEILSQFLWYNSHLKRNKLPFCIKKAYKEGLCLIVQLYDTDYKSIEPEVICKIFEISVMDYNTIISSIPKKWSKEIKVLQKSQNTTYVQEISMYENFIAQNKPVAYYYNIRIQEEYACETLFEKWQTKIGTTLSYDEFTNLFVNIKKITNYVKLMSFQYRFLHRAIVLNDKLKIWKLREDDNCTNCGKERETLEHFFYHCKTAKLVLKTVLNYYEKQNRCKGDLKIDSPENVMFNTIHENPYDLANFLILAGKQYLYACRCMNKKVEIKTLNKEFERLQQVELYNAKISGKTKKHYKKWYDMQINISIYKIDKNHDNEDYAQQYVTEILISDELQN